MASNILYPVLAASLSRTFAELIIFGYVPLYLYSAGERRILQLALITAVPALIRFVAANVWGALADVTGRLKLPMLAGLAGYAVTGVGLLFVSTGLQAVAVVSSGALFFAGLSPAGKALVSLRPGPAGTPGRALAWWLQLESWGWMLGSLAVAMRGSTGAPGRNLLAVAAGLAAMVALWVAIAVPEQRRLEPDAEGQRGRGLDALRHAAAQFAALAHEWRRLYGHPLLVRLFTVFSLATLAGEASFTVFGFYVVGLLGGSEALYGTALTIATAFGLVAYAWLGAPGRHPPPGTLLVAGGSLYTLMYAAMAAASSALVAAAAFLLPVYALVRAGATWAAGSLTAASERGGGMGALDGAEAFSAVLGALMAGVVADAWGLRSVYVVATAVALLVTALAWSLKRRLEGAAPAVAGVRGV
ncbi:MAG: MFS transporter [Bacillota bacterium]